MVGPNHLHDVIEFCPPPPPHNLLTLKSTVLGGKQELGRELCAYVQRVHTLLAKRGVFSPRVMEFLKVREEEGVALALSPTAGRFERRIVPQPLVSLYFVG